MSIILLVGLLLKPPIKNWKDCFMILFGLLVSIIVAFTELLGIFVVSQKNMEALAFFSYRSKALLYVPNGLVVPSLEMKPGRFWFGIAFLPDFLSIGLHGRGLAFTPSSSCENLCSYKALLLSRAYGKLGKLSNLGFDGLVMSLIMDSL